MGDPKRTRKPLTEEQKEKKRVRNAAHYVAHKEEVRDRIATYRGEHPEEILMRQAAYRKAHPEEIRASVARRRARKAAVKINDLTADQFREICQAFNFRCAYCPPTCQGCRRKTHKLTQDHVTAVAHGGNYTLHNIVPACGKCNSRKGTRPAPIMVQPLLLTVAPPHKKD